jgi:uncharacterized membrane protein YgcG
MKPLIGLVVLAATLVALAGCGSGGDDKTLSPTDAQSLKTALSGVQEAVTAGDCATAEARAQAFIDAVNALPETAGAKTKSELRAAGDKLKSLAADSSQCQPSGATGLSGSQSAPARSTTSSTTAPPTNTETTTTTSSTTTTSTTTKAPPGNGGGGGNQGGNGGGGNEGGGSVGGGGAAGGGTGGTGAGGGVGKR